VKPASLSSGQARRGTIMDWPMIIAIAAAIGATAGAYYGAKAGAKKKE